MSSSFSLYTFEGVLYSHPSTDSPPARSRFSPYSQVHLPTSIKVSSGGPGGPGDCPYSQVHPSTLDHAVSPTHQHPSLEIRPLAELLATDMYSPVSLHSSALVEDDCSVLPLPSFRPPSTYTHTRSETSALAVSQMIGACIGRALEVGGAAPKGGPVTAPAEFWYDARARVAIKRVSHWLRVPWAEVCAFERRWASSVESMGVTSHQDAMMGALKEEGRGVCLLERRCASSAKSMGVTSHHDAMMGALKDFGFWDLSLVPAWIVSPRTLVSQASSKTEVQLSNGGASSGTPPADSSISPREKHDRSANANAPGTPPADSSAPPREKHDRSANANTPGTPPADSSAPHEKHDRSANANAPGTPPADSSASPHEKHDRSTNVNVNSTGGMPLPPLALLDLLPDTAPEPAATDMFMGGSMSQRARQRFTEEHSPAGSETAAKTTSTLAADEAHRLQRYTNVHSASGSDADGGAAAEERAKKGFRRFTDVYSTTPLPQYAMKAPATSPPKGADGMPPSSPPQGPLGPSPSSGIELIFDDAELSGSSRSSAGRPTSSGSWPKVLPGSSLRPTSNTALPEELPGSSPASPGRPTAGGPLPKVLPGGPGGQTPGGAGLAGVGGVALTKAVLAGVAGATGVARESLSQAGSRRFTDVYSTTPSPQDSMKAPATSPQKGADGWSPSGPPQAPLGPPEPPKGCDVWPSSGPQSPVAQYTLQYNELFHGEPEEADEETATVMTNSLFESDGESKL
eukprot:gene32631-17644_t